MKLDIEDEENRRLISRFPAVLQEIKDNIQALKNANISTVGATEDEKTLILANRAYIKDMSLIVPLGNGIMYALEHYKATITDNSPIISLIRGFAIYAHNKMNLLTRIRKICLKEPFYYYDRNRQLVASFETNNDGEHQDAPDLSFIFDRAKSWDNLHKDIEDSVKKFNESREWLTTFLKTDAQKTLQKAEHDRLTDIMLNTLIAQRNNRQMDTIMSTIKNEEEFIPCQALFTNFNSYLQRLYSEYWEFKIDIEAKYHLS